MIRFILTRALDTLRADVATLLTIWLAAMTWPGALICDLLGVGP